MGRKYTFSRLMRDVARASAAAERERQKQERARIRALEKAEREAARLQQQLTRGGKQIYLNQRISETEEKILSLRIG